MNLARITGWIEREPVFRQTNAGLIAQFDLLVTEGEGENAYEMEVPVYAVQSEVAETLKSLWSEPLEVVVEGKLGAFSKVLKGSGVEYTALKVVLSDPLSHSVKALSSPRFSTESLQSDFAPISVVEAQPISDPSAREAQDAPGKQATWEASSDSVQAEAGNEQAKVVPGRPGFRAAPANVVAPSANSAPQKPGGGLRSLGSEGGLRSNHPSGPLPDRPAERSSRMTIGEQLSGRGGVGRVSDLVVGYATGAQAMDRAGRPAMPDVNDEIPW